jgi:hypothetical protein
MVMRLPDVPTTPAQWKTILWGSITLLVAMGSVGLFYSWLGWAVRPEPAAQLLGYSFACWALAAAIYSIGRAVRYFVG